MFFNIINKGFLDIYIQIKVIELVSVFSQLDDKRRDLGKRDKLNDIRMSIIAVTYGVNSYNELKIIAMQK